MRFTLLLSAVLLQPTVGWLSLPLTRSPTFLSEIRPPTEKATTLEFGWDGTTALGGAVVDSQPARMLEDIRASGEQVSEQADLFLQNAEMDPKGFKFSEFMEMVEECYETQDLLWTNGGMVNEPGVNAGAAAVFSVAAIKGLEKEPTLELFAEHYRSVLETPDGMDHMNIRNFMKNGWEGVNFENGISLTKKVKGESDWGFEEESWIP